jgi:hypothetical protein
MRALTTDDVSETPSRQYFTPERASSSFSDYLEFSGLSTIYFKQNAVPINTTLNLGGQSNFFANGYFNRLFVSGFNTFTPAKPTNGRSSGSRIILWQGTPNVSPDYAIGIASNEMWYSTQYSNGSHRFYLGTREELAVTNNFLVTRHMAPYANAQYDLGLSILRYSMIYLVNNPNVSSDERIKQNVEEIPFGLEYVCKLRPVSFEFRDEYFSEPTKKKRLGFIAQEVENVTENAETYSFITQGSETEYAGLDYVALVPVLVKAVQELENKVNLLQARLAQLENR